MKIVQRDQHFLHTLKNNKCKKFQKILLESCSKDMIALKDPHFQIIPEKQSTGYVIPKFVNK